MSTICIDLQAPGEFTQTHTCSASGHGSRQHAVLVSSSPFQAYALLARMIVIVPEQRQPGHSASTVFLPWDKLPHVWNMHVEAGSSPPSSTHVDGLQHSRNDGCCGCLPAMPCCRRTWPRSQCLLHPPLPVEPSSRTVSKPAFACSTAFEAVTPALHVLPPAVAAAAAPRICPCYVAFGMCTGSNLIFITSKAEPSSQPQWVTDLPCSYRSEQPGR